MSATNIIITIVIVIAIAAGAAYYTGYFDDDAQLIINDADNDHDHDHRAGHDDHRAGDCPRDRAVRLPAIPVHVRCAVRAAPPSWGGSFFAMSGGRAAPVRRGTCCAAIECFRPAETDSSFER